MGSSDRIRRKSGDWIEFVHSMRWKKFMNRKFIAMLGALSVAAVLACVIERVVPALAQTASGANSASAASAIPDAQESKELGPCPAPGGWQRRAGGWACDSRPIPPPRGPADCPPGSRFTVLTSGPGCSPPTAPLLLGPGDPVPGPYCEHDSDCGEGFCNIHNHCERRPRAQ